MTIAVEHNASYRAAEQTLIFYYIAFHAKMVKLHKFYKCGLPLVQSAPILIQHSTT